MHRVRMAARENRLTSSAINERHYVPALEESGRGWVADDNGIVLGFAVGNRLTGNIWALFVDPAYEGRGLGRSLHDTMVTWLFDQGLTRLWLGTEPGTRAQKFYESLGWSFVSLLPGGEALYELFPPSAT
jgi:GNAT superfamily N-acetyltransferase